MEDTWNLKFWSVAVCKLPAITTSLCPIIHIRMDRVRGWNVVSWVWLALCWLTLGCFQATNTFFLSFEWSDKNCDDHQHGSVEWSCHDLGKDELLTNMLYSEFWENACSRAAYLVNRTVSQALRIALGVMLYFKEMARFTTFHLHHFGWKVCWRGPKKWQPRVNMSAMFGYCPNRPSYRLWNLESS
jgi:hypothetical protein